MANHGDWTADFEALARQYWTGWNEMMRQAGASGAMPGARAPGFGMPGFGGPALGLPQGMGGMGGWQDMLAQWTRAAMAMGAAQPQAGFGGTMHDTLGRFQAQAGDWYGRMQALAAQVAGQGLGAAEIASKWKELLEQNGENAWLEMFRAMQSPQAHGFEQWYEAVQPMLQGWRNEARSWLGMPAFGVAREHQERLQALMKAQLDYQESLAAHNEVLLRSAQEAHENFERKLSAHEAPGLEITSARALFDLWIDAAEEAFAAMALSGDYREVYGRMVNAQMKLRQDVQREIEQATGLVGMPTRTEMEAAHQKIAQLERLVRRLQRQGDAATDEPVAARRAPARKAPARAAAKTAAATPARKPAKKAVATKKVAKRPAKRKATQPTRATPAKAARKTVKRSR